MAPTLPSSMAQVAARAACTAQHFGGSKTSLPFQHEYESKPLDYAAQACCCTDRMLLAEISAPLQLDRYGTSAAEHVEHHPAGPPAASTSRQHSRKSVVE